VEPFVSEGDLLAVGRPLGRVKECVLIREGNFFYFSDSVLVAQAQRIFARVLAEPGDPFAVGRPCRRPVRHAWRTGDVAKIAFIGGYRYDFAASLKNRPGACWREARIQKIFRFNLSEVRSGLGKVPADTNVYPVALSRCEIIDVYPTELLVNNAARSGGGGLQIEPVIFDQLPDLVRFGLILIQRHHAMVPV